MDNQEKQTTDNQSPLERLGEYGVEGGPGRPKGLKNRFTLIKQDMLEVWEEENGKERFRELFRGSQRDFYWALEKIIALMPKESLVDLDSNVKEKQVVIYSWQSQKK